MPAASLDDFLAGYPPEIRELVLQTRILILTVIPDAVEIIDPPSKIIAYGYGPKYSELICAIAPYPRYINLIFSRGVELPDPEMLLHGTGKRARHLKISHISDIEASGSKALLEEARRLM